MMSARKWSYSLLQQWELQEARSVAFRYVSDKLGVSPVRVVAFLGGDMLVYLPDGRRYFAFWLREPVGQEDYYVEVHVCWSSPCSYCGRVWS